MNPLENPNFIDAVLLAGGTIIFGGAGIYGLNWLGTKSRVFLSRHDDPYLKVDYNPPLKVTSKPTPRDLLWALINADLASENSDVSSNPPNIRRTHIGKIPEENRDFYEFYGSQENAAMLTKFESEHPGTDFTGWDEHVKQWRKDHPGRLLNSGKLPVLKDRL